MNDRIKLAEALDRFDFSDMRSRAPDNWTDDDVCKMCSFDPFTDANDDYAVLEWYRQTHFYKKDKRATKEWMDYVDTLCDGPLVPWYQIGDYARATVKILP